MLSNARRCRPHHGLSATQLPGHPAMLPGADLGMLLVDEIIAILEMRIFLGEELVVGDDRGGDTGLLENARDLDGGAGRGPLLYDAIKFLLIGLARLQGCELRV